jgi:hypothetical protein
MDDLNKKVQEDISRILSQVDKDKVPTKQEYITGDIPPTERQTPSIDPQPTRLIDIHVYDLPPEETLPTGEETTPPSDQDQQQDASVPPAGPQRTNRRRAALLLVCGVCIVLLAGIGVLVLYPLLTTSATVTIVPITRQLQTTDTITVVTGHAATGAQQIAGSLLSSVTMSQQQTAPTTGKGHQDAQAAHGYVTFYNAAPYTQTITAGTLLTGADGVQIVTDQDAIIPAVNYPTLGQATILAHSVIVGPGGNVRAGDVYGPCCRLNVSEVNGAFRGGQQARDYQTVTQQDIDGVASSLKNSLDQSVQAALKTQVQSDQTLITPVSCQQSITPDHRPGTEATQVQVTVSETCTGATYNTQSLQRLITQQMTQEASKQLGDGYSLNGTIQSSIVQATPKDHTIMLQVKSTASYAYQFTQEQQQSIKSMIQARRKPRLPQPYYRPQEYKVCPYPSVMGSSFQRTQTVYTWRSWSRSRKGKADGRRTKVYSRHCESCTHRYYGVW